MAFWFLIGSVVIALAVAAAVWFGQKRETARVEGLRLALGQSAAPTACTTVDFATLAALPPPVLRYFRRVLNDGQKVIQAAHFSQTGALRTKLQTAHWSAFTARQWVVPAAPGFVWSARVAMPLATHVGVQDSYVAGAGSGRVSLLSALAVAAESGQPELNAGALHRYLAEAVWYPTALLPQFGVLWTPIDDHAALATLSDHGITVTLEFRFKPTGEVSGIYSPGRYGRFAGHYRQVPWEGHFADDFEQSGLRVPRRGEVGWYDEQGALQLVWKGELRDVRYEFVS